MAVNLPYTEEDIQKMLACQVHLGTKNVDFQMEKYTFKRRHDGDIPSRMIGLIHTKPCSKPIMTLGLDMMPSAFGPTRGQAHRSAQQ